MDFEELSTEFYEDLNGRTVSASIDDGVFRVFFECDDWRDYDRRRRFELIFEDVAESTATPSSSGCLQAFSEHPLLWQHNEQHLLMHFSSAPAEPIELIGRFYEAQKRLTAGWRELGNYLHASSDLLRGGYGLLAKGPPRVIEEYARVIGGTLQYSVIQGHTPRGGYRVVLFDECYVVCRNVSVVEHDLGT